MELFDITVYYLEMWAPSNRTVPVPRDGLAIRHVARPTVPFYRSLYNSVGEKFRWLSRRKMSDEQLAAVIEDPLDEIHVLYVDGVPAGFAELDRRQPGEIELVQFGLTPDFIGKGIGKWFLQWTIDKAWSFAPSRFWLHTCTLDHVAALPNYLKAGFTLFKEESIRREY